MRPTKNGFRSQTPLPVSGPRGDVLCRSARWEDPIPAPTLPDSGPDKVLQLPSPLQGTGTRMPALGLPSKESVQILPGALFPLELPSALASGPDHGHLQVPAGRQSPSETASEAGQGSALCRRGQRRVPLPELFTSQGPLLGSSWKTIPCRAPHWSLERATMSHITGPLLWRCAYCSAMKEAASQQTSKNKSDFT